jgi:MFS family permease
LSSRPLRLYLLAHIITKAGTTAHRLALGWFVLQIPGASGWDAGIVLAMGFAPAIVLGPVTGALADRYSRRRIMIICQSSLMVVTLTIAGLAFAGMLTLWWLIALSLVSGVLVAIDMPAQTSLIPALVPADQLRRAIALMSLLGNIATIVGPVLAGIALAVAPAAWVFFVNALTYGVVVVLIARIALPPHPERVPQQHPWRELAAGITHLWRNKDLAVILALLALTGAFATNYQIASLMIAEEHGGSPTMAASAFAGFAIGCLAGSLLAVLLRSAGERAILLCAVLFSVSYGLGGALPPELLLFSAAPAGVAWVVLLTSTNAKLQASTGDRSRGRVMTAYITAMCISGAVGGPVVGALADRLGPGTAMTVEGAVCSVLCLAGAAVIVIGRRGGGFQRVRAA